MLFFSDEAGKLQVWDLKSRKAEPVQTQDICGKSLNSKHNYIIKRRKKPIIIITLVIAPYAHKEKSANGEEKTTHFVSVADETGTLHVLYVPKHLYTRTDHDV